MEKEDSDAIRHISETLDDILVVLSKPQNRVMMILNTVATGITLLGIISILDIIKNWIGG
jgi:hypothetical protein